MPSSDGLQQRTEYSWQEKGLVLMALVGPLILYAKRVPFPPGSDLLFPPTLFGAFLAIFMGAIFGVAAIHFVNEAHETEAES